MNDFIYYLAGPMTGIPKFNFPYFLHVAAELRTLGLKVICPAELDHPETRKAALSSPDGAFGSGSANGETWGDFLARDVKLIADSDINAMILLPGWLQSKGARTEAVVAMNLGYPLYEYDEEWGLMYLSSDEALDDMKHDMPRVAISDMAVTWKLEKLADV